MKYKPKLYGFRVQNVRRNPASKREKWPVDQESLARDLFKDFIAERNCPNKKECMPHLHKFPHCRNNYRKLVEKINNFITAGKRSDIQS